MTPKELRRELRKVAAKYSPVAPYLTQDSFSRFIDSYVEMYKRWSGGERISGIALDLEISPDKEEALDLELILNSPDSFVGSLDDDFFVMTGIGVVVTKIWGSNGRQDITKTNIATQKGKAVLPM